MTRFVAARGAWAWPAWLPRGGTLPAGAWQARHRAVTVLLWLHALAIPPYAVSQGNSVGHGLFEALPVLFALLIAGHRGLPHSARASAAAMGLMVCSGLVVHLSGGMVEAHFHFFVMIPLIALYEAWLPFALGVAYVLVHHGVMGTLDPRSVYNHPAAWEHPWLFAGVHAAFFASACIACVVNWWLHERARGAEAQLAATLEHRASHDALTGLPNRAALLSWSAGETAPAGPGSTPGATSVMMLDLDRFKEVNDTLGHSFGDHLLQQVGTRLRDALRPADRLVRLGGDEFAVVLDHTDETTAHLLAQRLVVALRPDFLVDGMLLGIDASIGITTEHASVGPEGPGTQVDLGTMLRQADIAMYEAKRTRQGIAVYDPEADDHSRQRLALLAELRGALERDELVLHYQPKVSMVDQELVGVEALIRWAHPERGLLGPGAFIPLAEHTALIMPLTRRVVDLALGQTARWLAQGRAVPVAVNVSPRCLLEPDFVADVMAGLRRTGVPAHLLRLEITESTLVVDPDRARAVLEELSDAGVGLSIDDFGTGYSSMSYLRHLPIDELKIDRSFVAGMLDRHEDAVLVQSAIDLGHNLGLSVVAEGVETADVLSALAASGCDTAQGFLMSRPMPAGDLEDWLAAAPAPGARSAQPLDATA